MTRHAAPAQPRRSGAAADCGRPAERDDARQGQHGQQQQRPARTAGVRHGQGQGSGGGAAGSLSVASSRPRPSFPAGTGTGTVPALPVPAAREPEVLQRGGEPRAQPRPLRLLGRGAAPPLLDRLAPGEEVPCARWRRRRPQGASGEDGGSVGEIHGYTTSVCMDDWTCGG